MTTVENENGVNSFSIVTSFYQSLSIYFDSLKSFKDPGIEANRSWLQTCTQERSSKILEQLGPGITPELLSMFLQKDPEFFQQKENPFCQFICGDNLYNRLNPAEIATFWSKPAKPAVPDQPGVPGKPAVPAQASMLEVCMRTGMRAFALLPHVEKLHPGVDGGNLLNNMLQIAEEQDGLENLTGMIERVLESICIDGSDIPEQRDAGSDDVHAPDKTTVAEEDTFETATTAPHKVLQSQEEKNGGGTLPLDFDCDPKKMCAFFKQQRENIDFDDFRKTLRSPEVQDFMQCVTQSPDLQNIVQGKGGDLKGIIGNLVNTFATQFDK
jgi:hypothetical protein